jgi:hypothetical protein
MSNTTLIGQETELSNTLRLQITELAEAQRLLSGALRIGLQQGIDIARVNVDKAQKLVDETSANLKLIQYTIGLKTLVTNPINASQSESNTAKKYARTNAIIGNTGI